MTETINDFNNYKFTYNNSKNQCNMQQVIIEAREFELYLKHTRPVNVVGYFFDKDTGTYDVNGFVLSNNSNSYKKLYKGKIEKTIMGRKYNIWMEIDDLESEYDVPTSLDFTNYFLNANSGLEEFDILTTYNILYYRNCNLNGKAMILNVLNDKMSRYDNNLPKYYNLCTLYLYLTTNANLMDIPSEKYTVNKKIKYINNTIVDGYNYHQIEIDELTRIINIIYHDILNYIDLFLL